MFTASLKINGSFNEKKKRVEEMLNLFQLNKCSETYVLNFIEELYKG